MTRPALLCMPNGFFFLILAQFASGLADNAFMILGVYFLQEQGYPPWWAPLLKFSFTMAYVLLAAMVGPLADAFPKTHLMAAMNGLKLVGVILLVSGAHPLCAFALTGLAAALYAPAKYGWVCDSVSPGMLVKANAWLEVSVVMSVMLGVALGGAMIHLYTLNEVPEFLPLHGFESPLGVSTQVLGAFAWVAVVYGISALFNMGVGTIQVHTYQKLTWSAMRWSAFWHRQRQLWSDPLGGMSLYVTTLCWGVGAVLQFAVLVWAQTHAGLTLQQGAYLQAVVALGVMGGAAMAAATCQIFNARRALPWGLVLAALLPCMALTKVLWLAVIMLLLAGWAGGMLLVPMNALLQHRGAKIMTSGRSIAVQGFNENLSVLVMLGIYSALLAWDVPLLPVMLLFSLPLLAAVMPWLGKAQKA